MKSQTTFKLFQFTKSDNKTKILLSDFVTNKTKIHVVKLPCYSRGSWGQVSNFPNSIDCQLITLLARFPTCSVMHYSQSIIMILEYCQSEMKYDSIDMASPSPLKRSVYLDCQKLLCHWNGNSNLPIISINWRGHQIVNDARRQIINRPSH